MEHDKRLRIISRAKYILRTLKNELDELDNARIFADEYNLEVSAFFERAHERAEIALEKMEEATKEIEDFIKFAER